MKNFTIEAKNLTLALLAVRKCAATVCPSEVARRLAAEHDLTNWRELMPTVHTAIDDLVADGQVRLSWKHKALVSRMGPYRICKIPG